MSDFVLSVLNKLKNGRSEDLLKAHREGEGDSWKFHGDMMWYFEANDGADCGYQRSVVYNKDLKKKSHTGSKPRLFYRDIDYLYSWRTEREVELEEGDVVFVGSRYISDGRTFYDLLILQVKCIVAKKSEKKAIVRFQEILSCKERPSINDVTKVTPLNFRKGAKKALKFKEREPDWFNITKKYIPKKGL